MGWWLLDEGRRFMGDALGQLVDSQWTMPAVPTIRQSTFSLMDFGGGADRVLLVVPAPIKRPYIWDLAPRVSVVRTAMKAGWRIFLVDWARDLPADIGLEQMVSRIIEAATHVVHQTTRTPIIAGHSLGGTLTALAVASDPAVAAGVILIESPTGFGARAGAFAPQVAKIQDAAEITALLGGVPGSFLNRVSVQADHHAFVNQPYWDWVACLADPDAMQLHLKVRRWSLDEVPLPAQLFEDVVELLYRRDLFMRGRLRLFGALLNPALPHPVMTIFDPRSRVVPPSSVLPLHDKARHPLTQRQEWGWEPGTLLHHLAPLVGRDAHATLWPRILGWGVAAGA